MQLNVLNDLAEAMKALDGKKSRSRAEFRRIGECCLSCAASTATLEPVNEDSYSTCALSGSFFARARCLSAGPRYLRLTRLPRHERGPVPGGIDPRLGVYARSWDGHYTLRDEIAYMCAFKFDFWARKSIENQASHKGGFVQLVSRYSCVADRLLVAVRIPRSSASKTQDRVPLQAWHYVTCAEIEGMHETSVF